MEIRHQLKQHNSKAVNYLNLKKKISKGNQHIQTLLNFMVGIAVLKKIDKKCFITSTIKTNERSVAKSILTQHFSNPHNRVKISTSLLMQMIIRDNK